MNIEQIKADLHNNVTVSRQTWHKLVEAALIMQKSLKQIEDVNPKELPETTAFLCRVKVEAL